MVWPILQGFSSSGSDMMSGCDDHRNYTGCSGPHLAGFGVVAAGCKKFKNVSAKEKHNQCKQMLLNEALNITTKQRHSHRAPPPPKPRRMPSTAAEVNPAKFWLAPNPLLTEKSKTKQGQNRGITTLTCRPCTEAEHGRPNEAAAAAAALCSLCLCADRVCLSMR